MAPAELGEQPTLELHGADLEEIGAVTRELLLRSREWTHRRSETVEFEDATTARRRVLVDFTVPEDTPLPAFKLYGSRVHYVPIALIAKRKQRISNVTDEENRVVPLLTRSARTQVAIATIRGAAKRALKTNELPKELDERLRRIAGGSLDDAEAALREIFSGTGHAKPLRDDPQFLSLAHDLAWSYLLLIPVVVDPNRRRVVNFSYVERFDRARPAFKKLRDEMGLSRASATVASSWIGRPFRRLARGFLWAPRKIWFATPAIASARSYHFQVEAPEGLQVTRAEMRVTRLGALEGSPWQRRNLVKAIVGNRERGSFGRTHLYIPWLPVDYRGIAIVHLRPRSSTLVRPTWLTALFAAFVLTVGWKRFDALTAPPANAAVEAAAALLLVVPSLLALYLARPGEPDMTTQVLFFLRLIAAATGLLCFCAAGLLVVTDGGHDVKVVWGWFARAAMILVGIVSISWACSRRRPGRPEYVHPTLAEAAP